MIRLIVEAGMLVVLGLWSVWDGYQLMADARSVSSFDALGPDRYIMLLGIVLIFLGVLYLHLARTEKDTTEHAHDVAGQGKPKQRRLYLMAAAFAGYILLAPLGGYVITTAIFFFAVYWIMDVEGLVRRAATALVTTAAYTLVFIVLADIPMPMGIVGPLF